MFGAVAGGIWNRMDSSNENRSGFVTWVDTRGTADGPIHLALGTVGGAAVGAAIAAAKHWGIAEALSAAAARQVLIASHGRREQ